MIKLRHFYHFFSNCPSQVIVNTSWVRCSPSSTESFHILCSLAWYVEGSLFQNYAACHSKLKTMVSDKRKVIIYRKSSNKRQGRLLDGGVKTLGAFIFYIYCISEIVSTEQNSAIGQLYKVRKTEEFS